VTIYKRGRALRDYLISVDEAARLIFVTTNRIRTLAREGYIKPHARKGFYRLGDVVDGHAEAVRMRAIAAPHERAMGRSPWLAVLTMPLEMGKSAVNN
jgi:hypothetical protein